MAKQKIEIEFDLENPTDRKIFRALKNLRGYKDEPNLSKAIIRFVDNMTLTIVELESAYRQCLVKKDICIKAMQFYFGRDVRYLNNFLSQRMVVLRRKHQ